MQSKLFVRNLSFKTTEGELQDLFAQYGEVKSTKIPTDRDTGNPRGFAFVEMNSASEAQAALTALEGSEFAAAKFTLHSLKKESVDQAECRASKAWTYASSRTRL